MDTTKKKTRKKNMNLQFVNSKIKEATRSTLVDVRECLQQNTLILAKSDQPGNNNGSEIWNLKFGKCQGIQTKPEP